MISPAPVLAASALGLAPVTWSVGILEPAVAGYALRLYRNLGTRVGWWLFTTFSVLALAHLLQAGGVTARVLGPSGSFDFIAVLIPLLLLIGMAHTESALGHRVRAERKEKNLQLDTDIVAEVVRENEGLQQQVSRLSERAKALEDAARQHSFLFDENPQPMWLFDRHSLRILAANNAALAQYGFTLNEFLAKTIQDILPTDGFAVFLHAVAQPVSPGESPRVWRHRRKDGALFGVEVRELDLEYAGCEARLVVASDITWRQQEDSAFNQEQNLEIASQEPPPIPTSSPPVQKAPAQQNGFVTEMILASTNSAATQKEPSKTILLVEPDQRMRVMARMMLEWNRYRVVETDSCSVAETVWPGQAANIDLLLTAVALPGGVSGRQLAERLRKSKPSLKVLFTYDSNKSREDFNDAELVAKPFNTAALLGRLGECFPQSS